MNNKLSHKTIVLIVIILLLILLLSLSAILLYKYLTEQEESQYNTRVNSEEFVNFPTSAPLAEEQLNSELIEPSVSVKKFENQLDLSSLDKAGWIPSWASQTGLNSLNSRPEYFNTISPVWYEMQSNGNLKSRYPTNRSQIINFVKTSSVRIIPTVGMFDHNLFSQVLRNEVNRKAHVNSIVSTVVSNNYTGIDLDYESTSLEDKELYFDFLKELSSELRKHNKVLVITVLPKWGDSVRYSYKPETREVQDWARISQYADEIRIMAYDYTHLSDKYPGPIGPISWIEDVLIYAKTKIPPEKTVLGIHLYAYEWYQSVESAENLELKANREQNVSGNSNTARAYTYKNVLSILQSNQGESSTFEGENVFFYTRKNDKTGIFENRALVYISPDGVKERMLLAQNYDLNGVVFWRLGDEGGIY